MIAVTSGGIIQSTAISEYDGIAFQGFTMGDIGEFHNCFPQFFRDYKSRAGFFFLFSVAENSVLVKEKHLLIYPIALYTRRREK
jgi:hypothetical protein